MEQLDQQDERIASHSINPLNNRGTSILIGSPVAFGIAEMLFHAHPLVGGAVAALTGALAYRHYDEVESSVALVAKGMLRTRPSPPLQGKRREQQSFSEQQEKQNIDIRDIAIPIGSQRNDEIFYSTLRKMKSILILGMQEGGKSNTATHLIRHFVKNGAHLAVIDKHARTDDDDSLTRRIAPFEKRSDLPVGYDPNSSLKVIGHVESVLKKRMGGGKIDYPLFIVVDEFTAIMEDLEDGDWQAAAKALKKLLSLINQEGRKHQVYALCIGQMSNASNTGGTKVRDLFATRIVHRMYSRQANMLGLTHVNKQIEVLGKGEVFIQIEGQEAFWLKIPLVKQEALKKLANSLPQVEKQPSKEELNQISFDGISNEKNVSTEISQAGRTVILPETGMEAHPWKYENHVMHENEECIYDTEELSQDAFAVAAQDLINYLWKTGKCADATMLVREQAMRFAFGTEDRTTSQIAKEWGFEGGRGWQKTTGLLNDLKEAVTEKSE